MNAAATKAALLGVLRAAVTDPTVLVSDGAPGGSAHPDIVAVLGVRAVDDYEEEVFIFDLVVSCYVGGGQEAQTTATIRAHVLLDQIRAAIYASPTLSGTCREAVLDVAWRTAEGVARDDTNQPVGRLSEISAEVHVWPGRPILGSIVSAHRVP